VYPVAPDGLATFARDATQGPPTKRTVDFSQGALGKGAGEPFVNLVRLGDKNQAACVLVESVDKSNPFLAATVGQLRSAMMDERVDEGAGSMSRRGMHHQSRLFVEREEGVVFVNDIEGNGFAGRFVRIRRWRLWLNGQGVAVAQSITWLGFFGMGMELDETLPEQRLGMVSGPLQDGGEKNIEALSNEGTHLLFT
jgi:hypothetical protein